MEKNDITMPEYLKNLCWGDFDEGQRRQILYGLEKRLDVSAYAKSEFNTYQMEQIICGLERGLDVSVYAKPEYNAFQMSYLRKQLIDNTI